MSLGISPIYDGVSGEDLILKWEKGRGKGRNEKVCIIICKTIRMKMMLWVDCNDSLLREGIWKMHLALYTRVLVMMRMT
jgi:uncharacterized membrane protein YbaN (DUF454 family)